MTLNVFCNGLSFFMDKWCRRVYFFRLNLWYLGSSERNSSQRRTARVSLPHPESFIWCFIEAPFIATLCNLSFSVPTRSSQSVGVMQQNGLWRQGRQTATWMKLSIASKRRTPTVFSRPLFIVFPRVRGAWLLYVLCVCIIHWKQYEWNIVSQKKVCFYCCLQLTASDWWWLSDSTNAAE